VVPADLNAFLHQLESNIAWAAAALGDGATARRFSKAAAARRAAMDALLWDEAAGARRGMAGLLQAVRRRGGTARS
jgi:alpha,alpha-trehalase